MTFYAAFAASIFAALYTQVFKGLSGGREIKVRVIAPSS